MKINFKQLLFASIITLGFVACDQKEEVDYTPQVYDKVAGDLTVNLEAPADVAINADRAFDASFTSTKNGIAYYALDFSTAATPTAESLVYSSTGLLLDDKVSLTSGVASTITFEEDVMYGGYEYAVFSVMASEDGYLSEVKRTLYTTPDTADPVFDRDNTTPAHNASATPYSPFGTIDLAFSEPVTYQGGTVTFSAFFSGRVITVSDASAFSSNGTTVSIADHGTFAPDDAILVTWDAGTFKDNSGKSVDALTGFGYYFWTSDFTIADKASLMPGMYNYSTVFYGGLSGFYSGLFTDFPGSFLPDTGTYEITADTSDATGHTLNGINLFSGFNDLGLTASETLPIVINPTVADELDLMPSVASPITSGGVATYWSHYGGSFFGLPFTLPGFYDFDAGTITHYVSLYYADDNSALDDLDYLYTRIGTYARSKDATNKSMEDLIELSKSTKKVVKRDFKGEFAY
jgi:hypothetical protein